jgi:DNA-binding transcriptional ArsR family regulator
MVTTASFASTAALIGDPARAAMLHAVMDGRALTAGELARAAGVTAQTASSHLAQLNEAGLLRVEKQGRHRYHRLATAEVARLIEGLMQVTAQRQAMRLPVPGPRDAAMRLARTCYDHIAGRLGVALAASMTARGFVELSEDAGLVTAEGLRFLGGIGIDLPAPAKPIAMRGRPICRPCLDWSERRPHLAGKLGALLCQHSLSSGWVRRRPGSRTLEITPGGQHAFREVFGAEVYPEAQASSGGSNR